MTNPPFKRLVLPVIDKSPRRAYGLGVSGTWTKRAARERGPLIDFTADETRTRITRS